MMFDVMTSFAKNVSQPPHITGDHYDGKKSVPGLVSGAKFKKNTVPLHGVLLTHVYAKFKID